MSEIFLSLNISRAAAISNKNIFLEVFDPFEMKLNSDSLSVRSLICTSVEVTVPSGSESVIAGSKKACKRHYFTQHREVGYSFGLIRLERYWCSCCSYIFEKK